MSPVAFVHPSSSKQQAPLNRTASLEWPEPSENRSILLRGLGVVWGTRLYLRRNSKGARIACLSVSFDRDLTHARGQITRELESDLYKT